VRADELEAAGGATDRVDYAAVRASKGALLRLAFAAFEGGAAPALRDPFAAWCAEPAQAPWLEDWILFAALRGAHGERPWSEWPEELRDRRPAALAAARRELAHELRFHAFAQFLFARQWRRLREVARRRGIALFGDLPIYVAHDSADVWAHRELFALDRAGRPTAVAGVPPDYFSADGQLWGNPLYRWRRLARQGFAWWIDRLRVELGRFDLLRLDHFRGFVAYWRVPVGAATARDGRWVRGPGEGLFAALTNALGELPIVAEDLGVITPEVDALRTRFDFPGMRVLQFGFAPDAGIHLPHRHAPETVVYTGTHDNDTTRGWFANADDGLRARILDYLGCRDEEVPRALLRTAYASVARLAMAPLQDLLGLGGDARMNTPGRPAGNWSWRLPARRFDERAAAEIRRLVELTERLPADAGTAPPGAPQPPARRRARAAPRSAAPGRGGAGSRRRRTGTRSR
jgi:4-alpha-glucanotransferase